MSRLRALAKGVHVVLHRSADDPLRVFSPVDLVDADGRGLSNDEFVGDEVVADPVDEQGRPQGGHLVLQGPGGLRFAEVPVEGGKTYRLDARLWSHDPGSFAGLATIWRAAGRTLAVDRLRMVVLSGSGRRQWTSVDSSRLP